MRDFHNANRLAKLVNLTGQFDPYEHGGRGMLVVIDATLEELSAIDPTLEDAAVIQQVASVIQQVTTVKVGTAREPKRDTTRTTSEVDAVYVMLENGDLFHVGYGTIECEADTTVERMLVREPMLKHGGRMWPILWLEVPTYLDDSEMKTLRIGDIIGALDNHWRRLLLSSRPSATVLDEDAQALQFQHVAGLQWLARRQQTIELAKEQGRNVSRQPLELMQLRPFVGRTPKQRRQLVKDGTKRTIGGRSTKGTKCTVEIVKGLSTAARAQTVFFAQTECDQKDCGRLMLDTIERRLEGNSVRRYDALISILTQYAGGIHIDDERRWLERQVRHRLGMKKASMGQIKTVQKEIGEVLDIEHLVRTRKLEINTSKGGKKKKKKWIVTTERVPLIVGTAFDPTTGKATAIALNPSIRANLDAGRGWWLLNSIMHIDKRDGGFTYNFLRAVSNRGQMKDKRYNYEDLDLTLERAGVRATFRERERKHEQAAHDYLDGILADNRLDVGVNVIDWTTRRLHYKTAPLWPKYAQHQQQVQPLALPPAAALDA